MVCASPWKNLPSFSLPWVFEFIEGHGIQTIMSTTSTSSNTSACSSRSSSPVPAPSLSTRSQSVISFMQLDSPAATTSELGYFETARLCKTPVEQVLFNLCLVDLEACRVSSPNYYKRCGIYWKQRKDPPRVKWPLKGKSFKPVQLPTNHSYKTTNRYFLHLRKGRLIFQLVNLIA